MCVGVGTMIERILHIKTGGQKLMRLVSKRGYS